MDEDMKKNRIFLIFLCCFSIGIVAYHGFVCYGLNSPRRELKGDAASVAVGGSAAGSAAAEAPSPTEELRTVRTFETESYPALREAIAAEAGFDLPIEVDWPSLAVEGWSHIYETAFPKVYFLPIVRALKSYAADSPDKNGLRRILAKVTIKNSGRYFNSNGISLDSGVLTIDHQPQANVDEGEAERANRILELLKSAAAPPDRPERP